jgi:RNA polymerase sigma factor (sigma-70 family)
MMMKPRGTLAEDVGRCGPGTALDETLRTASDDLHPRALRRAQWILRDPIEAEDAVQQAWLQAMTTTQGYDRARGPFAPWFLRIVDNASRDILRRARQRPGVQEFCPDSAPPPDTRSGTERDAALVLEERASLLGAAVALIALEEDGTLRPVQLHMLIVGLFGLPETSQETGDRFGMNAPAVRKAKSRLPEALLPGIDAEEKEAVRLYLRHGRNWSAVARAVPAYDTEGGRERQRSVFARLGRLLDTAFGEEW